MFIADVPPPYAESAVLLIGALALLFVAIWLLKRLRKKDGPAIEQIKLPHGLEIYHYNKGETDIIYKELWGHDAYLPPGLPLSVRPGAVVIDAGANIGMFSLYMWERCGGDVTLYAFEPVPSICRVLEANARMLNESAHNGRVEVLSVGLSDVEGEVSFLHHPKMSIWSTAHGEFDQQRAAQLDKDLPDLVDFVVTNEAPRWVRWLPRGLVEWGARAIAKAANETERVDCRLVPLSSIIDEHQIERIDLLKIDVEGNEWQLLMGIRDEHWPMIAQITMEVEDFVTLARIKELLEAHGFAHASSLASDDIHAVGVESELSYLRAWRPKD